ERKNARQLHLELNAAVLVQVPEEAVFIVFHRGNRGDDQSPAAAHFGTLGKSPIGVLPENSIIFFMHADGIFDRQRLAAAVADRGPCRDSTGCAESSLRER